MITFESVLPLLTQALFLEAAEAVGKIDSVAPFTNLAFPNR
jgi:hypothetical protein